MTKKILEKSSWFFSVENIQNGIKIVFYKLLIYAFFYAFLFIDYFTNLLMSSVILARM